MQEKIGHGDDNKANSGRPAQQGTCSMDERDISNPCTGLFQKGEGRGERV